jgi:autotransporter-associated beta strand protein
MTAKYLSNFNLRALLAMSMLFCAASALAQPLTWDPNGNGGATGGSGNWNTSTANWYISALPDVDWGQVSGTSATDGAIFGGGDGAYSVTNTIETAYTNLTFNNSGYTFSGSQLWGAAASTIIVANGKTVTFSNQLTGAGNGSTFFEAGSNSIVNILGGATGGQQPEFQSTNGGTFYLNGSFGYNVTYADAIIYQTNGSYTPNGFFLGRTGAGGLTSATNGVWVATGPTTTFTMSGANLYVGRGGNGTGTFIISNGATVTIPVNNNLLFTGDNGGHESGVVNMYSGTLTVGTSGSTTGGIIAMLGSGASTTTYGYLNQMGGVINAWGGIFFGENTAATYTGSIASVTNSGGFLYIGGVGPNGGGMAKGASFPPTINITFSGGTVGALGNWSSSLPINLATLNGNITFQCANASSSPFTIALSGPLTGPGGLNVTGGGTLALSGSNDYAGGTAISNGTLAIVTSAAGATNGGPMTLDGSTGSPTLSVQSSPGQFFSTGPLTFQNATSQLTLSNYFGVLTPSLTVAPIQVSGNLAFLAMPTVQVGGSTIVKGTYPLIAYTGAFSGSVPSSVSLPSYCSGYLTNAANAISLVVTQSTVTAPLYWRVGNGAWDINTTANWYQNATNNAVKYTDGSQVEFADTASGTSPITVTLNTVVNPSLVTFDNSAKNYTIAGTGSIAGGNSASVSLLGNGTVTLAGTNTYSGGTSLTGGQLNINNGGDSSGLDSAIGIGTLTINAGTAIDNTSGSNVNLVPSIPEVWNGNFTYVGSANSFNTGVNGSVTMDGNITITVNANNFIVGGSINDNGNNFRLSEAGNGVLTLPNYNSFGGGFNLVSGELALANSGALGSGVTTIFSGSLDNVSGADLTLGTESYIWSGSFSYVGESTNVLDLGSGEISCAAGSVTVNVMSNFFETDGDIVCGNSTVTKTGNGTWIFGGFATTANTLQMTVAGGVVMMDRTGYTIAGDGADNGHSLIVESNALVLDSSSFVPQINPKPGSSGGTGDSMLLTLGGVFDLNGDSETPYSITMNTNGTFRNGNSGTASVLNVASGQSLTLGDTTCQFYVTSNSTLTIECPITGPGGLTTSGLGELELMSSNSYTGETVIESGALGLQESGSISNSVEIYLASSNSALDLSESSLTDANGNPVLTLQNGQTLGGFGVVTGLVTMLSGSTLSPGSASVVGTLTITGNNNDSNTLNGVTMMKLNASGLTNDQLAVQQGSLAYGGTLVVNNLSGTFAAGNSFTLFNTPGGLSGSFGGGISLPPLGATKAWVTNNLSVNGTISVIAVAAPPSPRIVTVSKSGGNLIFSGTNGPANGSYYVLASTNLTLALSNWTVLSTNTFSASGAFSVTNSIGSGPASYFILEVP